MRTWSIATYRAQAESVAGADITYVSTRKGLVYTAFATDVFSRRIVGLGLVRLDANRGIAFAITEPSDCMRWGYD